MDPSRRRHQSVNDGDWIRYAETAPFLGDSLVNRKYAVRVLGDKSPQPRFEDTRRPGIPPADLFYPSADLSDNEYGEKHFIGR